MALASNPVTAPYAVYSLFSSIGSFVSAISENAQNQAKVEDATNAMENFIVSSSSGTILESVGYGKLRLLAKSPNPVVLNSVYEFL